MTDQQPNPQQPYSEQPYQQPYQQQPYQQQPYQQQPYQQQPYQQPVRTSQIPVQPPTQLRDDFSLGKFILLSIITFGIYGLIVMIRLVDNVNTIITPYDGKKTMNYFAMWLLGIITLGIYPMVWYHQLSDRVGYELSRRQMNFEFNSTTYWLWGVLGSFIIVGPFIYFDKLFNAVNMLSKSYNTYGY